MASGALELWEGRSPDEWRTLWGLPSLLILETTPSTSDVIRRLADQGAPAGSLVLAEHQSAGRGRMGREWHDAPGKSLLFSVLLRPDPVPDPAPGTAPLRVGIAVARALRAASAADIRLKWPNDLVLGERKVAGILCEATTAGGVMCVVAGIGINVKQRGEDFHADLRERAASLEMATRSTLRRDDVMTSLIDALRPLFRRPLDPLADEDLAAWAALDALAGREVGLSGALHTRGTARGIAPDGALLLETPHGLVPVSSATVRTTTRSGTALPP